MTMFDTAVAMAIPLAGEQAPKAFLSLLAAGDMGFGDDGNGERRRLWLRGVGFDPERAISPDLVHSRIVLDVTGPADARGREADGLVSSGDPSTQGACLVMTVADCMPIFIHDSASGAYGLLHSGWKGTGILEEAMGLMARRYGTRGRDVSAVFGPRIGPCCYVVDEARARLFADEFGEAAVSRPAEGEEGEAGTAGAGGGPRLDLVGANIGIARRLGLGSVHVVQACTCCGDGFGSFRRQGPLEFTRMAAAIGYQGRA